MPGAAAATARGRRPAVGAVLFTGSGTAAVEATLASAVPEGRALLIVDNGVYGDRMRRIAAAHRIPAEVLRYDFTTPVPPADVARVLREHPEISHVALVHHETTTGPAEPGGGGGRRGGRGRPAGRSWTR